MKRPIHAVLWSPAICKVVLCCGALLLASPGKAYGYADPGTGAFVYQAVYAAFLGGTFYLRRLLGRVFHRRK